MSLAIAAHSLSEALENVLKPVHVVVDTPSATAEMTKSNTDNDFLNIFLYRVAPSTVHAAQASNEPFFLRIFALLTPFARRDVANGDGDGDEGADANDYVDLQILTDVLRYFHENPVTDVMHAQDGNAGTAYRLHAIPQAPEMEELNHIWTTQNSAIGYRLSAVFEFSLVPVDPLEQAQPATPVRSAMAQVAADMDRKDEAFTGFETDFTAFPHLRQDEQQQWDGPEHLPTLLARRDGALLSDLNVASDVTSIALRLAGPTGFRAVITTSYRDEAGLELAATTSRRAINAVSLDDISSDFDHTLEIPANTTEIVISVRGGTATGGDLALDRVGSTITLTVEQTP